MALSLSWITHRWASSSSPALPTPRPNSSFLRPSPLKTLPASSGIRPLGRRGVVAHLNGFWTGMGAGALAAATVMAASLLRGTNNAQQASLAVKRGMELFNQGDVGGSLVEFDKATELDARQKPYLWQRGLSLYYLNRFAEGAAQFREDVAVNPNDSEEAIWSFLCEAQLYGIEEARKQFLEVGPDRRPVVQKAYQLFKDGGDPEDLRNAFGEGSASEFFYAALYAGLYYESLKNDNAAKSAILTARRSHYGQRSNDYMAVLAKVHCKCRSWGA